MTTYTLVTGDFVPTGGMDRANLAVASYLVRQEQSVCCVSHRVAPELLSSPRLQFAHVPKLAGSYFLASPLLDGAGRYWSARHGAKGGRTLVNGGNCLAHGANWVHYLHAAYRPEFKASLPRKARHLLSRRYFLATERQALKRASVIIANSERTRQDILQHLDIPSSRVHTVYYGSDSDRFSVTSPETRRAARQALGWNVEGKTAIFIGALGDRRKGFDTLYSAWRELCSQADWDVELAVVGVGAELPLWQARAEKEGLSQRIRFLGFRRDVPTLLAASDVLASPTRYEAYGLGVHEALISGVPAMVTTTAGVAERYTLALQSLLVASPDDVGAWATRLRDWRKRMEFYRTETAVLAQQLNAHSWDDMAAQIKTLMDSH